MHKKAKNTERHSRREAVVCVSLSALEHFFSICARALLTCNVIGSRSKNSRLCTSGMTSYDLVENPEETEGVAKRHAHPTLFRRMLFSSNHMPYAVCAYTSTRSFFLSLCFFFSAAFFLLDSSLASLCSSLCSYVQLYQYTHTNNKQLDSTAARLSTAALFLVGCNLSKKQADGQKSE